MGLRGGNGTGSGSSQVEGWRWKTRPKASLGLVKEGGRRARNESYLGQFRLFFLLLLWLESLCRLEGSIHIRFQLRRMDIGRVVELETVLPSFR